VGHFSPKKTYLSSVEAEVWQNVTVKSGWIEIISIWVLVAVATVIVSFNTSGATALASFAVILAGSIALVSMIHLFLTGYVGFVKKLVYVAGGSYLMLAIASVSVLVVQR